MPSEGETYAQLGISIEFSGRTKMLGLAPGTRRDKAEPRRERICESSSSPSLDQGSLTELWRAASLVRWRPARFQETSYAQLLG